MAKKTAESEVPRKHHLVIYSDDESMMRMLKSMDRFAKEGNLFRCFYGPPHCPSTELLSKLKWYDGTVEPYLYSSTPKSKEGTAITNPKPQKYPEILWQSTRKYC